MLRHLAEPSLCLRLLDRTTSAEAASAAPDACADMLETVWMEALSAADRDGEAAFAIAGARVRVASGRTACHFPAASMIRRSHANPESGVISVATVAELLDGLFAKRTGTEHDAFYKFGPLLFAVYDAR